MGFFNSLMGQIFPEYRLTETIHAWINTEDWSENQLFIAEHLELLSDDAERILKEYHQSYRRKISKDEKLIFQHYRTLLRRCREVGIVQAYDEMQQTLISTLQNSQQNPVFLNNLGNNLLNRYELNGQINDLEEAIQLYRKTVAMASTDSIYLNNLGNGLLASYKRTGRLTDLKEAIDACQRAVNIEPLDSSHRPVYLNNLGNALIEHYQKTKRVEHLEKAIQLYEQAVALKSLNPSDRSMYLNNLGSGLSARYERRGDIKDLENAIRFYEQAVYSAKGLQKQAGYLNNLGTGLRKRYTHMGKLEDLDESIRIYQQAITLTPHASPSRISRLSNLSNSLLNRYEHTGCLGNLEEAVALCKQCVELTPPDSPDYPDYLNNLGNGLIALYERSGQVQDLEYAIQVSELAVSVTYDSPNHPGYSNNLATMLRVRYARKGRLEDLEESIRLITQAVNDTPMKTASRIMFLTNLGIALCDRHTRLKQPKDLEEAILLFRQVVGSAPLKSPDLAGFLTNLGTGLSARYVRDGKLEDLEESIRVYEQAVILTPMDSPFRSGYLNNLSNGLCDRYAITEQPSDIEKAIQLNQQALAMMSANSPEYSKQLNNLGNQLRIRYNKTEQVSDLEYARTIYRKACETAMNNSLGVVLVASRNWGNWAFKRCAWEESCSAYEYGIQATSRLLQAQLSREDKNVWLSEIQGLAIKHAYAFVHLHNIEHAIEIFEQGHAQLLRETIEYQRKDLRRLPELGFESIYNKFTFATKEEDNLQATPVKNRSTDWLVEIERVRTEVESVAGAIRKQAGAKYPQYRFFLQSLPFDEIQNQAHDAPLIYLAATEHSGFALIVYAKGEPKLVSLPLLTDNTLHEKIHNYFQGYFSRENWFRILEETLYWLGETMMAPILTALNGVPRAVLIPSGLLGLLPLHAAIIPKSAAKNRKSKIPTPKYALDFCNFTYAPNAQALYHARVNSKYKAQTLLAVDNPDGSLPFTEAEVYSVIKHFPKAKHLLREQATKEAVLQAIPTANILHFSTHGMAGWDASENARLKLADSDLTMPELFNINLENARLAVLSACETGLPGTKLPDEVQSLPSAFMQAGVPGVIGSLWSVSDMSTAILMTRFYDLWQDEDLSAPEALRNAQIWLRDSTVLELKSTFEIAMKTTGTRMSPASVDAFFKRVILEDSDSYPFSHPFYWAAFTYTGI